LVVEKLIGTVLILVPPPPLITQFFLFSLFGCYII